MISRPRLKCYTVAKWSVQSPVYDVLYKPDQKKSVQLGLANRAIRGKQE
jgi:hypothetical protein